jgi:hypothetical protein
MSAPGRPRAALVPNLGADTMTITIHCDHCGSENVFRDAFAAWNPQTQEWELAAVYDAATCEACENDTRLTERPMQPEPEKEAAA